MSSKILFVLPSLNGGGAERVFLTLAREMEARGHVVALVVLQKKGALLTATDNLRVDSLDARNLRQAIPRLARLLRRERPDTVVSAMPVLNNGVVLARILSRTEPRLVLTDHSNPEVAHRSGRWLRRHLMPLASRNLYPKAEVIVGVSEGVSRDLARFLRLPASRVAALYNPIEIDPPNGTPSHPWLSPSRNFKTVISVGRLTEAKDYPTLLAAFARVHLSDPSTRLVIYGEGELRGMLEAQVKEAGLDACVSLPGFSNTPRIEIAAADLFVLSSRWEGLANIVAEALSTGTPVISTDCPYGPREIIDIAGTGVLVPVGDPEALGAAMLTALAAPTAETGIPDLSVFSISKVGDAYEAVLTDKPASTDS